MTAPAPSPGKTAEHARLAQATGRAEDDLFESNPWYEWGPYLSERAWGTVREDYSDSGDAWSFFPHDHARSRAKLGRIFGTLFDENAFLSPHGFALSKRHSTPYQVPGMPGATIEYEPAESHTAMYGGNSNWRGPVWFPINYLVIRALLQHDQFFGPEFTIEYPTGSGQQLSLRDIAGDLSDRLISIWLPGLDGRRPVYGGVERMQTDPAWKDNLLFYEYFHGDNGAGLGAMHQTGWTALVADLLLDPPRRVRRLVFYDDASITPDLTDVAAGPAG